MCAVWWVLLACAMYRTFSFAFLACGLGCSLSFVSSRRLLSLSIHNKYTPQNRRVKQGTFTDTARLC